MRGGIFVVVLYEVCEVYKIWRIGSQAVVFDERSVVLDHDSCGMYKVRLNRY